MTESRAMKPILFALACLLPGVAVAQDVTVFAAASLKEPLDEIARLTPGVTVSYGGSGTLARQVLQGAPADLVFLAHPDWMDALEEAESLVTGSRTAVLSNEIVLVGPAAAADVALTPEGLTDALGPDGRLAIGLTRSVPAGIYGREALVSLGLWDTVRDRLAEVDNVRAALALAARGEVPLALIYTTDARVEPTLRTVARLPSDSHAPILYEAAVVAGGNEAAATEVLQKLLGPEARIAFEGAGFVPPPSR